MRMSVEGGMRKGCVLLLAALLAPAVAQATACYGTDAGTKYQVSASNPGGWTSHASIEAAVVAATNAGRTVVEFQGTWTGVNETVKLRNSNLTFQGAASCTMAWAANTDAFGGMDNLNFSATLSGLGITVSGSGRAVGWASSSWNGVNTNYLVLTNCSIAAYTNAIHVAPGAGTGGGYQQQHYYITVRNCTLCSATGAGIASLASGNAATNQVCVYDSRLQTWGSGVDASGSTLSSSAAANSSVRIERSELVCSNAAPAATVVGVYANPATYRTVEIVDSLIAGYGTGVRVQGGVPATPTVVLANNTITGTGSSTGLVFSGTLNWSAEGPMLVNNIFAGHGAGISLASTPSGSSKSYGTNNAFFANFTNGIADARAAFLDGGRILPGYTLAQAFSDPGNASLAQRNYRLRSSAGALINAGRQYTTTSLGGTATYVDANANGTYQDSVDYLIDLGGAVPTATSRVMTVDAAVASPLPRLKGTTIDVGAYEAGPRALTYSTTQFDEQLPASDGHINNLDPMLLSLAWDTFTGTDNTEITNQVAVANLPAGLTLSMIRTNAGTQAVVRLLGQALAHADGDDVNNLGFAFQDGAFSGGSAATVVNASRSDLTIVFTDPALGALAYGSTNFTEDATWNDGRIDNTVPLAITLANDVFTGANGDDFAAGGSPKVVVSNLPNGLTAVVTRAGVTNASVTLVGRAAAHAAASSVATLGFAFQDAAFVGNNAANVTGASRADLRVTFLDPATNVQLLYGGGLFSEAPANDGSIATTIAITLTNDVLTGADGDDFVSANKVVAGNLPAGLTAVVTRVDLRHLNATLTGRALAHNRVNNAGNLRLAFQDNAFYNTAAAAVTNAVRPDLASDFLDPVLTWSGGFTEAMPANNGSMGTATVVRVTLQGDTFTGADGSMSGKFTTANVPSGLSVAVTRSGGTNATLTLAGNASAHALADSVSNLTVSFSDSAFSMGGAAAVTNGSVTNLGVTYYDPSRVWYVGPLGTNGAPCDGSAVKPWATIAYALGQATAWDTIHVLAGTLTQSGISVSKPIFIEGDNRDTTIVQAAATRKTASDRIFAISADTTLRNLTLRHGNNQFNGSAVGAGGCNLRLENCRVTANDTILNATWNGGAVYAAGGSGSLTLVGCEFSDNASGSGGAVYCNYPTVVSNCLFTGNTAGFSGGGLIVNALLRMVASTVTSNTSAVDGGGIAVAQGELYNSVFSGNACTNDGGGICINSANTLASLVANCTVYGNLAWATTSHASYEHGGGGIYSYGPTTIRNCTIVSNACPNWHGGGINQYFSAMDVESTIVAGNLAAFGPDIFRSSAGAFAERYNLVGNSTNSPFVAGMPNASTSYVGTASAPLDPLVLPPADNQGPTRTCALLPGSLAINHGSNPLGLSTDQRGGTFTRTAQGATDIGAFEFRNPPGTAMLFR
jgi:hypothetical protein